MNDILIRTIELCDDAALARIIRQTLEEFGVNRHGTVYYDETTYHLSSVFNVPGSIYYAAEQDGKVLGGAGIYPTEGLGNSTCELVKMYLVPESRGKGLGITLLNKCIAFAKNEGYKNVYLETMPELSKAVQLYEKLGFKKLSAPLGKSGHHGCGIWMLKSL